MPTCSSDTTREILNLCTLVLQNIKESDSPIPSTEFDLTALLARSIDKSFTDADHGHKLHEIDWWKETAAKNLVSIRRAMALKGKMEDVEEAWMEAQATWKAFEGDADDRFMTDRNIDKAVDDVEKKLAVLQEVVRGKKRKFEEDVDEDVEEGAVGDADEDVEEDYEYDSEGMAREDVDEDYEYDSEWMAKEDAEIDAEEDFEEDVEEDIEEDIAEDVVEDVKEDVEDVVGEGCQVD